MNVLLKYPRRRSRSARNALRSSGFRSSFYCSTKRAFCGPDRMSLSLGGGFLHGFDGPCSPYRQSFQNCWLRTNVQGARTLGDRSGGTPVYRKGLHRSGFPTTNDGPGCASSNWNVSGGRIRLCHPSLPSNTSNYEFFSLFSKILFPVGLCSCPNQTKSAGYCQ